MTIIIQMTNLKLQMNKRLIPRKRILERFLIALCSLLLLAITSCSDPAGDLKKAEQTNTEQAYQEFIQKHPAGPLAAQAEADLEKVVYEAAKHNGTSSAFQSFLRRFPQSGLAKEAESELESDGYNQAKRTGTTSAFQAFLGRFPGSPLAKQARAEIEELDWNQTFLTNTPQAYLAFSIAHPNSSFIKTAIGTIRGRYWENIMNSTEDGVLVTIAGMNTLAKLSIEDAKALGVIVAKPMESTHYNMKVKGVTFDIIYAEMLGACPVRNGTGVLEMIEPADNHNASVILSADGTRILAWDLRNAKRAEQANISQPTYPNGLRKGDSGPNPESQDLTMTFTHR